MEQIFRDPDALLPALAEYIVSAAADSIAARGRFSLVLSGGSSPKKLYELLTSDGFRSRVEWSKVFFFFGDERCVPQDDPNSNFLMAKKALFDPMKIAEARIFPIDTSLKPEDAAKAYERDIVAFFHGELCRFDLILLGLGDNSHTASLFPHTPVLNETSALVAGLYIDEVKMYRVTFTAPLINLGMRIAFLVFGAGKADAVHHILKEPKNTAEFPAQLVQPDLGDVVWFLDDASAARLKP